MRALFVCHPAYGHFHPLAPLAAACEDAGHDVAFATAPSFAPVVEEAGFEAAPAGLDWLEHDPARTFPEAAALDREALPGFLFQEVFLKHAAAAMAGDLPALAGRWGADLLIHECTEFGAPVAGELTGLPWVGVEQGAVWPGAVQGWISEPLDRLRAEFGLAPDPLLERRYAHLHLVGSPPSFQLRPDPEAWSPQFAYLRPVPFDGGARRHAPEWPLYPSGPRVLVGLGTVFTRIARDVLGTVVEALAAERLPTVVTLAGSLDVHALGPQPPWVRVLPWVPFAAAAEEADLVVGHGGWGTTMATLAAGKPTLVLPQGADQFDNAFRVTACGAGLRLLPAELTVERVRAALRDLLDEPLFFANAQRLRREIEAMPSPAATVPRLEQLAQAPPAAVG